MHKTNSARFNQSFQIDEVGLQKVEENLNLGKYRDKAKMYRDAVDALNQQLRQKSKLQEVSA